MVGVLETRLDLGDDPGLDLGNDPASDQVLVPVLVLVLGPDQEYGPGYVGRCLECEGSPVHVQV